MNIDTKDLRYIITALENEIKMVCKTVEDSVDSPASIIAYGRQIEDMGRILKDAKDIYYGSE